MATPSQAQLAEERDIILADIASNRELYNSMIAKGQVNSAKELLATINKNQQTAAQLDNKIKNYTQFSAERAAQDAEIAANQNFLTKNSPANQLITNSSATTSTFGGNQTTTTAGAPSLTPEAANSSKQANLRAQAFTANPTGRFGPSTIDKAVSSGAITPEEGAALRAGSIPESERFAAASAARQAGNAAVSKGTVAPPPSVTVTSTPNNSNDTTVNQQLVAKSGTVGSPSDPNNRNTTVVTNADGTKSEVSVNNTNATLTSTPISNNQLSQSTETTIVTSQNINNASAAPVNTPTNTPTSSITSSSPNNVRTAAEWNQVIDNIEVAKKSTLTQANGLKEQSTALQAQRAELSAQLTRAQQGDDQEYIAAIRSEISKVDNRIAGNKVVTSNVMKEVAQYDQDLNNAFSQQATAKSGPPNSNSTTQPANATFGPNTSVAAPELDPPITSQVQINTPNIPISPVAQSSSNNVQTAEEWKKVAAEQQAIAKEAGDKERLIGRQLADVFSEKEKIDKQIRSDATALRVLGAAVARGEKLEPEAQKRYDTALARSESDKTRAAQLDAQRVSLQSQAAPYTEQRTNAENAAQAALNKSKEALEANPNANSVAAPVGDSTNANSTGNPTDAQPDPSTVESANAQQTVSDTVGATQAEADFINAEAQKQVEAELGATQAEADFINAEAQKQVEAELGATQAEADLLTKAQLEADQNEYAFGSTQAEADFIINEQKQISEFESSLGAAGATQAEADAINQALADDAEAFGAARGFTGLLAEVQNTREQAITQDTLNYNQLPDWRVRISLAQGANYLYKVQNPGILKPLQATNGVVFPYTPSIQMGYVSNYDAFELVHSNYKIFQYKNSAVEQLSITADFTAQDATEAAYVLAVIHFFRTVTKMFYGKDQNPKPGTPPPLCYINGMGDFQFNQHPLVISNFSYTLPNDVDYIRAGAPTLPAGQSSSGYSTPNNSTNTSTSRMQSNNVPAGGQNAAPNWTTQTNIEPTYIPTKIQVSITALPIVTRKDISDNFSVRDYATGALMRGRQNSRGGIW